MDWKLGLTARWTIISSTLCLGGCMTPGYQLREAPGFSSTFQAYESSWHPLDDSYAPSAEAHGSISHAVIDEAHQSCPRESVQLTTFECEKTPAATESTR